MGFLSKTWKKIKGGVKSAFKKIGKGIKSAFKSFGKFMGKIGIVGQLAMSFILPGIGGMLAKGFSATIGTAFKGVTGFLAKGGKLAQTAGKILQSGAKFAKAGTSAFRTVTDGVSSFLGEFTKTALKKIPGMETLFPKLANASDSFFVDSATGKSAWSTVQTGIDKNITAITEAFNGGLEEFGNAKKILTSQQQNVVDKATGLVGDGTIPGSTAKTSSLLDPQSMEGGINNVSKSFENFKPTGEVDFSNLGDVTGGIDNIQSTIDSYPSTVKSPIEFQTKAVEKTFGEKLASLPGEAVDAVKDKYTDFKDGRTLGRALTDEALDYGVDAVSDVGGRLKKDVTQRLSQEVGIVRVPEAPVSYGTYVEAYQSAGIRDYGSAEINDRAMQMSVNPTSYTQQNPYGYGANIYQEQMNVRRGGIA
tara:strand:- start:1158 stop:2417 length:1260 start_codon:yes stop_codon:yes gene_type:complete